MRKQLMITTWNPNGTNDAYIVDNGQVIDFLGEAFYGINIGNRDKKISIATAMEHITVSPCTDGLETLKFLARHFRVVSKRLESIC
jgi:hypothetical protein